MRRKFTNEEKGIITEIFSSSSRCACSSPDGSERSTGSIGGAESNLTQAVEQSVETGENTDTAAVQSVEEDVTDAEEPAAASSELQTEEEQQETSEEETTEEAAGEETEAADDVPETEETEDPVSESSTEQDENGDVSEEETEAGWITNEDGRYSYRDENGDLLTECVAEIDGKYYGFDSDGRLYMNQRFAMDVEEDDEYVTKYFWASEDGSLYTDCWKDGYYIDNQQQKYYMGSDGAFYTGIHTIDGKQYYFYESGLLAVSRTVSVDGKTYFSDGQGVLTEVQGNNEWKWIRGGWYYIKDNQVLVNCVEKIENKYYAFDEYGKMYAGELFTLYTDTESIQYCANKDGSLKTNTWVERYGTWYYFGADGAGYEGVHTISGKTYYFEIGEMVTGKIVSDGQKNYIAQDDGLLVELKNDNWTQKNGNWYYQKNGTVLKDCIEKIGNAYYGFDENGRMYEDEFFTRSDGGDYDEDGWWKNKEKKYFAKAGGTLLTNGWKQDGETGYYFGADGVMADGIQTINGSKYYFKDGVMQTSGTVEEDGVSYLVESSGKLTANKNGWIKQGKYWYYAKNNSYYKDTVMQIEGKYYGFAKDGRMYTNESFSSGGAFYFASESGALYTSRWKWGKQWTNDSLDSASAQKKEIYCYYGSDGKRVESGLASVNGKNYLFESGRMLQNEAAVYDGKNYIADENGNLKELKEGWTKAGQDWYYVQNGKLVTGRFTTIGNDLYYFADNGRMASEGTVLYSREGNYIVGKDGKIQKDKLQESYNGINYCNEDGKSADGLTEINGDKYYFSNGSMWTAGYVEIDGETYVVGEAGKLVKLPYQGWKKVGDNWYYVDQGQMVKDGAYKIGNKTYVFSKYGRMLTSKNGIQVNEDTINRAYTGPAAAADGTLLKNTWMKIYEYGLDYGYGEKYKYYWQYYGENGEWVNGLITLKGKKYFISDSLHTDTILYESYIADGNGVLQEVKKNGWSNVGKYWYYRANGTFVTNTIRKIGDAYYAFDDDGHMYTNQEIEKLDYNGSSYVRGTERYYRASADGKLLRNTSWKDTNGDVYYYDADGIGYEGTHKINGVTCYFEGGKLLKNAAVYDSYGTRYIIDSKGNPKKMVNNQWVKVDSFWYYAQDGVILKNTVAKIDGKYYGFDAQGRMYENTTFEIKAFYGNLITYHASKGGALLTSQKYESGNDIYYFDVCGRGYEGRHYVDGKSCYFEKGKIVG